MFTDEQKAMAAQIFPDKKDAKQIVGISRIHEPGKAGVNRYIFDDGTELVEDDAGSRQDDKGKPLKFKGA